MDFRTLVNNVAKSERWGQISSVEIENALQNKTTYQAFSELYESHVEIPNMTINATNRDGAETYAEVVLQCGTWISLNTFDTMLDQLLPVLQNVSHDAAHNFIVAQMIQQILNN